MIRRGSIASVLALCSMSASSWADTATSVAAKSAATAAPQIEISSGMLAEDLRAQLRREMPWDPEAAVVDVALPSGDFRVADGEFAVVWRKDPQYEYLGAGTFRGEVQVDGRVQRTVFARVNIAAYDTVAVAIQPISRGDAIGGGNARLEKRELTKLDPGAFFSLDEVVGRIAKTNILPGQVLSARRLELPTLVKRNQVVTVETRVGGLVIRAEARAQANAAAGETVLCVNSASNLKISGLVRADGVVEVN